MSYNPLFLSYGIAILVIRDFLNLPGCMTSGYAIFVGKFTCTHHIINAIFCNVTYHGFSTGNNFVIKAFDFGNLR